MKVLQVIDSGGLYGAERVMLALMDSLRIHDVECTLASIAPADAPEKALEAEVSQCGFAVTRHIMAGGPDWIGTLRLLRWARKNRYDLLHTHGYKANCLIAGMPIQYRRIPVVATLHGWTSTKRLSRIRTYESFERMMLRKAERVVSVSEDMVRRWKLEHRFNGRLRIIPNGIRPPNRERYDVGQLPEGIADFIAGGPSIFSAGRLSPEKGFDVLIEAIGILRDRNVRARLVVVGEGREEAVLRAQIHRLGLDDAILMPGYLPNAASVMPHFSMVAVPSRSEGLPVVLLEALLSGLPVAATAVGDIPTVLERTGAPPPVPSDSPDALAEKLQEMIEAPPNAEKRRYFSKRAMDIYSADAMAKGYSMLYRELLGVGE